MNLFEKIEKELDELKERGYHVVGVVTYNIIPEYFFIINYKGKRYLGINRLDLEKALKKVHLVPLEKAREVEPRIFDVPFIRDLARAGQILCGVYERAIPVKD